MNAEQITEELYPHCGKDEDTWWDRSYVYDDQHNLIAEAAFRCCGCGCHVEYGTDDEPNEDYCEDGGFGYWNYRVMKRISSCGEDVFAIHEVYYNENNDVISWTVETCELEWDGEDAYEELKSTWEMMGEAFEKEVLDEVLLSKNLGLLRIISNNEDP